jgi:hypothetical protein
MVGTAVAGQNTTYLPHKGVLSPSEKALYVSYSDGAGPVRLRHGIVQVIITDSVSSMMAPWEQSTDTTLLRPLVSNVPLSDLACVDSEV